MDHAVEWVFAGTHTHTEKKCERPGLNWTEATL